jgi:hypothetical protein
VAGFSFDGVTEGSGRNAALERRREMSKSSLGLFMVAAIGLVAVTAPSASAANLKCKPTVKATNNKQAAIKVTKFKYKVAGGNEIYTEGLVNKRLAPGETEDWPSQTLGHAATGVVVSSHAVEYKNDNSGAGDGWGPPQTSAWITRTYTCNDNHTYPTDVN